MYCINMGKCANCLIIDLFAFAHQVLQVTFPFPVLFVSASSFSDLSRLCRLESAHALHNSSELDSALAYSQISVFRFPFSVLLHAFLKVIY